MIDNATFQKQCLRHLKITAEKLRDITTISKGYHEVLRTSLSYDRSLSEIVRALNELQNRLDKITEQLLLSTALPKEVLVFKPTKVDVEDLIDESISHFYNPLKARNIKINKQIISLPPDMNIWADRVLLTRALIEVISNAIKYTSDNGLISIIISTRSESNMVEFKIADNGVGISSNNIIQCFEPYFQTGRYDLNTASKTSFLGTGPGLGLTIAKNIIEEHNGHIKIFSDNYDEISRPGTSVTISLPQSPLQKSHSQ